MAKLDSKQLAAELTKARIARGLSIRQVCAQLDFYMPRSTLSYYETHGPSNEAIRLLRLTHFYGIPIRELFEKGNQETQKELHLELLTDPTFGKLCEELSTMRPPNRRRVIQALTGFLQGMATRGLRT